MCIDFFTCRSCEECYLEQVHHVLTSPHVQSGVCCLSSSFTASLATVHSASRTMTELSCAREANRLCHWTLPETTPLRNGHDMFVYCFEELS